MSCASYLCLKIMSSTSLSWQTLYLISVIYCILHCHDMSGTCHLIITYTLLSGHDVLYFIVMTFSTSVMPQWLAKPVLDCRAMMACTLLLWPMVFHRHATMTGICHIIMTCTSLSCHSVHYLIVMMFCTSILCHVPVLNFVTDYAKNKTIHELFMANFGSCSVAASNDSLTFTILLYKSVITFEFSCYCLINSIYSSLGI